MSQLSTLNQQINALKGKLANVKNISDTYDREYQDRLVDKPLSGFWRARGIITLQDWVLFFFFVVYGIIALTLTFLAFGSSSTNGVFNGVVVGATAFCFGVMISATIMRFA
jgi:hypothetical protein